MSLTRKTANDHVHTSQALPLLAVPMSYTAEKKCCSICDRQKICHVCKEQTLLACSDCRLNFGAIVYVCRKPSCRDEHERKCYGDKP
jgi:hypothetical protein